MPEKQNFTSSKPEAWKKKWDQNNLVIYYDFQNEIYTLNA